LEFLTIGSEVPYRLVWKRMLCGWRDVMNAYVRYGDLPYWYEERTNVGFLAAAV